MSTNSEEIVFGMGSANFSDYPSVQRASKAAVVNAIKSAGKSQNELPKVILMTPTIGVEEEVIEGVEEVLGENTPILGATASGPTTAVFGEEKVYEEGVSLAVVYTNLPVNWTFEGGFDVPNPHAGIVTKVERQAIVEINNRPALDVYDEWLDGEIEKLYEETGKPDLIRDLFIFHPIYRKYTSPSGQVYFLFSHPWPKDDTLKDRSVMTNTSIKVGEKIYLSPGTWGTFVDRINSFPRNARVCGGIGVSERRVFGIGNICGGVMGVIPQGGRGKLPFVTNRKNNDAPFIATFTWGEQGHFPRIGSRHGNLLTFLLVTGHREQT